MALRSNSIYVETDNLVQITGLYDNQAGSYVNSATILMSLYASTISNPDVGPAVDKGGGEVGIPLTGHSFVTGNRVRLVGTTNYDGEYVLEAATSANELVITETYVVETFLGTEHVYEGIVGALNISVDYVAASNGNYEAILPNTAMTFYNIEYYMIFTVVDGASDLMIRKKWRAAYANL